MFDKLQRIRKMDHSPILIGGCGRTGTSLMTAILDAHPDIFCIPEETNIFQTRRHFRSHYLNHQIQRIRIIRQLWKAELPDTVRRWCEKTPANVRHLNDLFREFGDDLNVILMIRDGRDVITSLHPLREGYYISIDRWKRDTRMTLQHADHPQVLLVPYESLVGTFRPAISRVLDFLEAPMAEEVLDYTRHSGVQEHDAFHGKTLRPIYTASQRKWENPEHSARIREFLDDPEVLDLMEEIDKRRQLFDMSLPETERA